MVRSLIHTGSITLFRHQERLAALVAVCATLLLVLFISFMYVVNSFFLPGPASASFAYGVPAPPVVVSLDNLFFYTPSESTDPTKKIANQAAQSSLPSLPRNSPSREPDAFPSLYRLAESVGKDSVDEIAKTLNVDPTAYRPSKTPVSGSFSFQDMMISRCERIQRSDGVSGYRVTFADHSGRILVQEVFGEESLPFDGWYRVMSMTQANPALNYIYDKILYSQLPGMIEKGRRAPLKKRAEVPPYRPNSKGTPDEDAWE